uniref:Glutathione S-transferase 11 n=1 Tax=Streltzoviella insularis TaxID=1206366 RepID=A0A7D5YVU4_9NEOP|nr:glutathione S-transferase 11 [Streltzoviella insularis]
MAPILYKVDTSPPARAAMMVADILGLQLNLRDLNPVLREQDTPEFTKKNPMRTIPILDEGDYSLADSHAIMLYLIDAYGKPQHSYLYPTCKRKRATINQRLFFDCGVLFPTLRAIMARTFFAKLTHLDERMISNIEDGYRILEAYLTETIFLADNIMTVADISVVATVSTMDGIRPIDEKKYPKLKHWLMTMSHKDFCRKINAPGCDQLVTILGNFMQNNTELVSSQKQKAKL